MDRNPSQTSFIDSLNVKHALLNIFSWSTTCHSVVFSKNTLSKFKKHSHCVTIKHGNYAVIPICVSTHRTEPLSSARWNKHLRIYHPSKQSLVIWKAVLSGEGISGDECVEAPSRCTRRMASILSIPDRVFWQCPESISLSLRPRRLHRTPIFPSAWS